MLPAVSTLPGTTTSIATSSTTRSNGNAARTRPQARARGGRTNADSRISGTLEAWTGDYADNGIEKATKRTRRTHSAAFKAKVAMAAIKGGRTLAESAQQFDVRPNQIMKWKWKRQLQERAADVFGAGGTVSSEPQVELKKSHAKIGQLALEDDFLSGALIASRPSNSSNVLNRNSFMTSSVTTTGSTSSTSPSIVDC
ncbi:transposase [Burkholderia pyrrocinia]|uniref:transposase n=1 Tax=Burkholderia pyrrocinia TaxID=60550 RepID=UPI003BAECBBF